MAANVLAYFAEGKIRVILRSGLGVRSQVPGRRVRAGAGGGPRNVGLVVPIADSRAWLLGLNPNPSPQRLAPDAMPCHNVLETKGVRRLESECLNARSPSNSGG